ncbi:myosin E [Toxoplasma gondii TgCatPRC2]|uniref:Myosin E n=5 Tax=Toxoplasma gondii TaxID=5811 RepID=V4YT22_TOXGV|nr:myosin E [Toxoplasma gondii ME49]AAF25495.1 myosin E [Toxoplasma gondii]ESS31369.1 myosin E [Toxoplasma gondii VEG]KYK66189.1 myosin E [Toxoplasma gondii TgCatPRC2]PIM05656.1 myosin E [Toxoplasma gondii COUG]EPT30778.1 myosin E [Toxoplasma gondii ME49]|eukprot:XP_002366595.1 myosin E [Toxoplasma gondii ME49]
MNAFSIFRRGMRGGPASAHGDKLRRGRTEVDPKADTLQGMKIWTNNAPAVHANADECFALCLILPESSETVLHLKQIDPPPDTTEAESFTIDPEDAFNANIGIEVDKFPDIGLLPHKNCAAVLDFLKQRYLLDLIYTTADPLLIAINPFKDLNNTTPEWLQLYRDAPDAEILAPHVFRLARTVLERLSAFMASQTIIVSGESGAGKTEATKQIMSYFAAGKRGEVSHQRIQNAVIAANPVLEAFGNAKTVRNNNSSRFGRFMQLQLGEKGGIEYGSIRNFLLEKVRVTSQEQHERSYHIFYQLVKGADDAKRRQLHLLNLEDYTYLSKNGGCYDCPGIDDVKDFKEMNKSLRSIGLNLDDVESLWSIIAGVLLLGNVHLESRETDGQPNAAALTPDGEATLQKCCALLFVDEEAVKKEILYKVKTIGDQQIESPNSLSDALMNRDSLAKAVYEKLFDWVVRRVNATIEPPQGFGIFMGMLDIFGFEMFENNSLEQLLINITNEQLQKNFIQIVFARETKLYYEEGIGNVKITWTDNENVIKALCGKSSSVLAILEDKSLAPGGTDEAIVTSMNQALKSSDVWKPGQKNPRICFCICHTIADIQYDATGFIEKNKDLLKPELCSIVQASSNNVAKELFEGVVMQKGKIAKGQLIASQFMRSLDALLTLISSTESHFIRCLKPNETKNPHDWSNGKVLAQLFSLSILEALQLKNLSFSYRRPYADFLKQFEQLDLEVTRKSGNAKEKTKQLLTRANVPQAKWALGNTMVFMKPDAVRELTQKMRLIVVAWEPLIRVLEACHSRALKMRAIRDSVQWVVRIQSQIRKARVIME